MKRILYAIPNYECNLSCSFCDLRKHHIDYDKDRFVDAINNFDGEIILFGGEPTLYKNRYLDLIRSKKINSVTTNLIDIDEEILQTFKNISVATSWTPERFHNEELFNKWLNNLEKASKYCKNIMLLITLSYKTIEMEPREIVELISLHFDKYITNVLFEYLVDDSKDNTYYEKVDKWLTEINLIWKNSIIANNVIVEQVKQGWDFNCSNTYTLLPNGTIRKGCPQYTFFHVIEKCYTCNNVSHCRPCILQNKCSYPYNLAKSVLENEKK